jgi:hypothetical protein
MQQQEQVGNCRKTHGQRQAGLAGRRRTKNLSKLVGHCQELDILISTQLAHIPARRISCVRHWSDVFLFSKSIRNHHQHEHTQENCS